MFYMIVYIMHYYILPKRTYDGLYCLENWAESVRYWNNTLWAAAVVDLVVITLMLIMITIHVITYKEPSSKESES